MISLMLACDSQSTPKEAVQVANSCVEADLIATCPVGTSPNLKAQADATCYTKESIECHVEMTAVCGNQTCEVGETQASCPRDCAGDCQPLQERCNASNREVCNQRGIWETLACLESERCEPTLNDPSKTFCASDEICDGIDNDCDGQIDEDVILPLSNQQRGGPRTDENLPRDSRLSRTRLYTHL